MFEKCSFERGGRHGNNRFSKRGLTIVLVECLLGSYGPYGRRSFLREVCVETVHSGKLPKQITSKGVCSMWLIDVFEAPASNRTCSTRSNFEMVPLTRLCRRELTTPRCNVKRCVSTRVDDMDIGILLKQQLQKARQKRRQKQTGRTHLYKLRLPSKCSNVKWRPSSVVDGIDLRSVPKEDLSKDRLS